MNPTNVVGRRVVAWIIDALTYAAISAISWFALTSKISGGCIEGGIDIGGDCRGFTEGSAGRPVWFLINLVAAVAVYWLLPALRGTSPGHAATGLRIISRDGGLPGVVRGLVRWLMRIVDDFPYILPGLVGFIAAVTDKAEHKRLGDRLAGTLVVDKRAAGQPAAAGVQEYGQYGGPALAGGSPPAGWYEDPQRQARLRWWDGSTWTDHTSN